MLVGKLLWTGILAGLSALSAVAARQVASRLWRLTTHEEPPTRR